MPSWPRIRFREGLRWLFRGSAFTKLERDIERMAAPLAGGGIAPKTAARLRRRIAYALGWLPAERAEKFYEMMARIGHSVR